MSGALLGRGISFPPRVGADGHIVVSADEDNIRECIEIVLRTEQRERIRLPEYGAGLGRFLFEPNTTTTRRALQDRIQKALAAWEQRVVIQSVAVDEDPVDPEAATVVVTYRLVATQTVERVSLTVRLGG